MKATELIAKLQELVEKEGDCKVHSYDVGGDIADVTGVRAQHPHYTYFMIENHDVS